ncbi:sulfur carrier protein ThiS [Leptobacterium flavescens]|uniref:Sulfur carrier protein ThiS n=1 Tax=Leptobacterium flavescens TaxID=472055 RepID=A0A6P0UQM4_9FLAO|nr:sulfur carrier protein ThiS [Leptobacterium flavescens]NER14288.1 sulfur carrier protein ThiS [Leptobacterium flavescens]
MIDIRINNKKHSFQTGCSLEKALDELKIFQNGIAVAVNNQVISRREWAATVLEDKDNILIITATQGG